MLCEKGLYNLSINIFSSLVMKNSLYLIESQKSSSEGQTLQVHVSFSRPISLPQNFEDNLRTVLSPTKSPPRHFT
uniref:Ovule protein n=1 Tax=Strongyloides venezuelensis TaxID=75913 RepID=A0A0K0G4R7_STRVS